jgi:glycolate oxidase iron-sulfur subunit
MIAVDVAGCGAHLETYGRFGVRGSAVAEASRDITEIIAEAIADGRLPRLAPTGAGVAVQDPCHLEHGQRVTDAPYRIIEAAGYDAIAADAGGLCCGAAGAYQVLHPSTGAALGRAKADRVIATSASIVASANAGCEMQLRRFLGEGTRIAHPIEIYRDRLIASNGGAAESHSRGPAGIGR